MHHCILCSISPYEVKIFVYLLFRYMWQYPVGISRTFNLILTNVIDQEPEMFFLPIPNLVNKFLLKSSHELRKDLSLLFSYAKYAKFLAKFLEFRRRYLNCRYKCMVKLIIGLSL
jgi:hypothetical protein